MTCLDSSLVPVLLVEAMTRQQREQLRRLALVRNIRFRDEKAPLCDDRRVGKQSL